MSLRCVRSPDAPKMTRQEASGTRSCSNPSRSGFASIAGATTDMLRPPKGLYAMQSQRRRRYARSPACSPSEAEAQSDTQRGVARLRAVEVGPVVGRFRRGADTAGDREVAVHAADEAVIALLAVPAALAIEAGAGEEAGGAERLGETVL